MHAQLSHTLAEQLKVSVDDLETDIESGSSSDFSSDESEDLLSYLHRNNVGRGAMETDLAAAAAMQHKHTQSTKARESDEEEQDVSSDEEEALHSERLRPREQGEDHLLKLLLLVIGGLIVFSFF